MVIIILLYSKNAKYFCKEQNKVPYRIHYLYPATLKAGYRISGHIYSLFCSLILRFLSELGTHIFFLTCQSVVFRRVDVVVYSTLCTAFSINAS